MSEQTIDRLTHTVNFERKISDGNYGSTAVSVFVQVDTGRDDSLETVQAALIEAIAAAKLVVFDELGIAYQIEADGSVREPDAVSVVAAAFPGAQVVPADSPEAASGAVGDAPPADKDELIEWALARFASHPGEFWDNRPKKKSGEYNPKAPDLKHKPSDTPIWLTPKGR